MKKKLLLLFITAFVLRLGLVFTAYHGDLNNNISWGTLAVERGLSGFYGSSNADDWPYSAPNQPPLTILMFTGLRMVWQVVENISWWLNNNFKIFPSGFIWFWESKGITLLVKLPGILADLGIGYCIYKYLLGSSHPGAKRSEVVGSHRKSKEDYGDSIVPMKSELQNDKKALLVLSVWLFNPITWYNSAVWGQTDSIVNLLGLLGIFWLLKKKLVWFSVFFTLSFLFKGSLGIFIPILGMIAIWQKHSFKDWLRATCYILLTTVFVSIWFHPHLDIFSWLVNLYTKRILPGEIGYLTANAFNFWWLVDSGKVLDNIIYFGLSARIWGIAITVFGMLGILGWLKKYYSHPEQAKRVEGSQSVEILRCTQNDRRIFTSLIIVSLLSFLFMTRMHERYLYPFFPYATILLGLIPGMLIPYIILSVTHLLNLYHLFWAPPIPVIEQAFQNPLLLQTISIINILGFGYLVKFIVSKEA
jgi:Gpi18-like mannosyltransferase